MRLIGAKDYARVAIDLYEILSVTFTALGLGAVAVQLGVAAKAARAETDRRRKEATIEAYTATLDRRHELAVDLPADLDADAQVALAHAIVNGDAPPEKAQALRNYLGLWESLATGVNLGVLDAATMNRLAGAKLVALSENYSEYIDAVRARRQNTSLYHELDSLAADVRKRRSTT